ncbi:MAG: tRNA (adenosine(37)-N6)-threonylcarbamoyltransferase complex dimerization subunit type 1 TsaB [Oscillospiraceae bacterium]|nr:tRNA (adenosine(37)-N6)-threonylcarbamoyltransferase complex dimerization subunit type 1 TsaB [Oscillospiraceae bacterium]
MKILSVDSSAAVVSVALTVDERILSNFFVNTRLKHSRTLMPMIQSLFHCSGQKVSDVDLFAVSTGPGSFTGLRIGISAIKGMSMALNKPCVGVSSLYALAATVCGAEKLMGTIICATDAKCGRIYSAVFENSASGLIRRTRDSVLTIGEFFDSFPTYGTKIFLVGDAAEMLCHIEVFEKICKENTILMDDCPNLQNLSVGIAIAAKIASDEGKTVSASELCPSYVCAPSAEKNAGFF